MPTYTTQRRWAMTADGRLVPDTDPEARTLYIAEGQEIDHDMAEALGLIALEAAAQLVSRDALATLKQEAIMDTATLETPPEQQPPLVPEEDDPARRVRRPDEEDTVEEEAVPDEEDKPVSSRKAIHAADVEDKSVRAPPQPKRIPAPAPQRRHPPPPKPKGKRAR